jgi:hypothetical protein
MFSPGDVIGVVEFQEELNGLPENGSGNSDIAVLADNAVNAASVLNCDAEPGGAVLGFATGTQNKLSVVVMTLR